MKKTLTLIACVLAGAVHASPRRTVIASGDCKDAELSSQTKAFHDTLKVRSSEDVLGATEFSERLFPQPSRSFEDIQRLLDASQGQFYEGQHAKASQTLDEALKEIALLPPSDARWKLFVGAQLLHGLNYRSMGRPKDSDAAFRTVLSIEPQYKLDPAYYAPSTRQAFEKVRKELARTKKVRLSVKSTLPASDVFLNGFKVGQTPLALNMPPGVYDISLVKGAAVSFPRQIQVNGRETPVLIDLAFEGSVLASPFPCLADQENEEKTLSHAIRLGGSLGVEEVIVVRLQRPSSGPKWLAATVINVEGGQKLREGGLKTSGIDTPPHALNALVDFVTTGKARPQVEVLDDNGLRPWEQPTVADVAAPSAPKSLTAPEDSIEVAPADRLPGAVQPAPMASVPAAVTATAPRPSSGLRVASYVVAGAGVAALGGAGVVRLMAQKDLNELNARLNDKGRINANDTRALALRDSLASKGNMMTGLLIGSGAALTTGVVLFLLSPSQSAPPATLGLSVDGQGASATLSGSF
jgi:hypothetical protein